jgi:hypothetical protein
VRILGTYKQQNWPRCFSPEAGELWLASRTPYISPKTFHEYELNLRTLGKAFGETKLREITADQIRAYQAMRTSQKCGPSGVNHECSVLQQISSSSEVFKSGDPRVLLPENTLNE